MMIYYFSGTGNSQYVAEQLAKYTKDEAVFIPSVLSAMQSDITVGPDEVIGLVFPVYAWAAPAVVTGFLEHVHVDAKAYAYAVCTCGAEAGKAMQNLHRVFPFKSAYSVTMPNNYIPMSDIERPELIQEKLNVAAQRVPKIASEIMTRSEVYEVDEGAEASFKTTVINPLFRRFAVSPKKFSADDTCVGCGECEHSCPFGVIKLVDKKPVWNGTCQMCMSCIMRCPRKAIQYGSGTRRRGRYVFPDQLQKKRAAAVPQGGEGLVEFISAADVKSFATQTVISKQLLTPENAHSPHAAVTEVHLRPGAEQARHIHKSAEDIWYVLRGSGRLLLAGDEEKVFAAGDVVRFTEGAVHGVRNDGALELVYLCVTCPPATAAGHTGGGSGLL